MRNAHVYVFATALCAIAFGIFFYKLLVTGLPLTPGAKTTAWEVERQITFAADGGPVKLTVQTPRSTLNKTVVKERFIAPSYGLSRVSDNINSKVVLAKRSANGLQTIYLRTLIHAFSTRELASKTESPVVRQPKIEEPKLIIANNLLRTAEERSADTATLVTALLTSLKNSSTTDSVAELVTNPSDSAIADVAVNILALKNIPARRVNGIDLTGERKRLKILHWLEVFIDGIWVTFSIASGEQDIPSSYFPWWYGTGPSMKLEGGQRIKSEISFVQLEQRVLDRVLAAGKTERDGIITFSLFSLPLATQDVYRILMVVPVGIFVLVILRNIIGVTNLGTFMPVLIALAFRETQLIWGLILFIAVVGSGLVFRFYLEHLRLLLVPRLASVLIFVLLLMAVLSVLSNGLGFERGLSVALFPMVIMAMTIERVSVIWDERGPSEALSQAAGSLLIAITCYFLMTLHIIEHLFFTFPELVLILLAVTLLIGRYTGYRLLELTRFRVLVEEKQ